MNTTPEVWETTSPPETPGYPPAGGAFRGALWLLGLTEGGSAPVADDDGWEPEVN